MRLVRISLCRMIRWLLGLLVAVRVRRRELLVVRLLIREFDPKSQIYLKGYPGHEFLTLPIPPQRRHWTQSGTPSTGRNRTRAEPAFRPEPTGQLTLTGVSNNADAVKYFLSAVILELRGARHFALAE